MPDIFRICPKVFQNIHIRPKHTYYNKKEKEVTAYVRLLLDHPSAPLLRQQQFRPHRMQPEMPCRAWDAHTAPDAAQAAAAHPPATAMPAVNVSPVISPTAAAIQTTAADCVLVRPVSDAP